MLAELYTLKQSLDAAGQGIALTHRDFQTPPGLSSYKTLIAKIDSEGEITALRLPLEGELPGLWTLKKYAFKFFPAIRMNHPLIQMALDDSRRESLFAKSTARTIDPAAWLTAVEEIEQSIEQPLEGQDFIAQSCEQGGRIARWSDDLSPQLQKLKAFAKAFEKFSQDPSVTALRLFNAVKKHSSRNPSKELLAILAHMLVGQKKEKKNKASELEFKVQIIFDYSDPMSAAFTLHDRDTQQAVLRGLNSESCGSATNETDVTAEASPCAFQSKTTRILKEPFGGFAIRPVINKEQAPYSKKGGSQGVPCNDRYHRAEAEGFPIGEELSRSLVGAMKGITSPEQQDKTWRTIRNGKLEEKNGKKKECYDVLVAFPNFDSGRDLTPVAPFGKRFSASIDDDDELTQAELEIRANARRRSAFAQAADPVCLAFDEKLTRFPDGLLTLLLIRQISPGQIQLAYGNRISIHRFVEAIRRWQSTEANLPPSIRSPMSFKGADGFRSLAPGLLFPDEVSSLLTHQWVRDGSQSARLNAPPVGSILDLFLKRLHDVAEKETAQNLLELLLQRSQSLLIHGGAILHKDPYGNEGLWQKFAAAPGSSNDPKWALLKTVSLMGTLLSLLQSSFQNYMKEHAYLTGFLLACADELHKQYHFANSDGKLPSTLIGNGLLGKAAEAPAAALAELMERSRIYIGWAKTARQQVVDTALKDDKSPEARTKKSKLYAPLNARNALEQMEETAAILTTVFPADCPPKELTVTEKAQMFLGYLTPVPRKSKTPTTSEETPSENDQ
jgi:hypothetical protein